MSMKPIFKSLVPSFPILTREKEKKWINVACISYYKFMNTPGLTIHKARRMAIGEANKTVKGFIPNV